MIDNSLLARLNRVLEDVECKVLIQEAIAEIVALREQIRFVHAMSQPKLDFDE